MRGTGWDCRLSSRLDDCLSSERFVVGCPDNAGRVFAVLIKLVPSSQQPPAAAQKRRESSVHSLSKVFVVAGCSTAAAQVIVHFRCVVDTLIQGLHTGLDRRSPQGLSRVVVVRAQPSPPVCLVFRWHILGLIAAATARSSRLSNVIDMPLHAPPSPLTTIVRARGLQRLIQSSRLHASCLPDHPQHSQRGAVGGKDRRVQQRHRPTIIFGAADQAHLTCASRPQGST